MKLEDLFQQMADHTRDECARCPVPYSCCSRDYCDMAADIAKDKGITLEPTGHPRLPFLGPQGCIVPPHLRPLCTLHTCEINSFGVKRGDFLWTERYFQLRDAIEEEAWKTS